MFTQKQQADIAVLRTMCVIDVLILPQYTKINNNNNNRLSVAMLTCKITLQSLPDSPIDIKINDSPRPMN